MRRALPIAPLLAALLLAAVPGPAGAAAKRHARRPACVMPSRLTFTRKVGQTVGVLSWHANSRATRWRVTRNGHTVGQTHHHTMRIGVVLDRPYRFAVVALDRRGRHTRCGVARHVDVAYQRPGAPQSLAISGSERGMQLDWLPGARGDGKLSGYRLLRDGTSVGQTARTAWTLGAMPNHSYRFTVVAVDSRGRTSAASNTVTLVTGHEPPSAPQNVQALSVSESSIGAQWDASSVGAGRVVGYRVLRDGAVVEQVGGTSTVLDNLAPSTSYGISVVAIDGLGYQSAPSPVVSARTQDPVPTTGHAHAYLLASTDESFTDFRAHYRQIGYLYPTYFDCSSGMQLRGQDDPLVTGWARARRVLVMPRVNCQGTARVHQMLTDPATRAYWLDTMVSLTQTYGYDGISLDLEAGPASDRAALTSFVAELAARLHADGKLLSLAASPKAVDSKTHPRSGIFDYPQISQSADFVIVMAWGLHWSTSAPGAQDEIAWATSVAQYVATMPLHRKFVYGTNLYAMDWADGGGAAHPADTEEYGEIVPRFPSLGAVTQLDPTVDGNHATYTDAGGATHDVWYPDVGTTDRRIQLADDNGFGGVAFWRLGLEDQRVWSDPLIAPGVSW